MSRIIRIGAICRADFTGLGIQSKEFFDNIPCKALVIDLSAYTSLPKQNLDWFPNQTVVKIDHIKNGCIPIEIILEFIKDIDVLITFETAYDYNIFSLCRQKGVKTILQLNYEFLDYPGSHPLPDLFAAPSLWHYSDIPEPKMFLPVPVNLNYFKLQKKEKTFVHIVGRAAIHNRNGTDTLMRCLKYIENDIKLIIRSQRDFDFKAMEEAIPDNIELIIDTAEKENYADNYDGGILVLPRKYGGLSLVANEAISAEMPVIMTDIEPNNIWLPKEWLVTSKSVKSFRCKKEVEVFEAYAINLAKKIDEFCNEDFYSEAIEKTKEIKEKISWQALLPQYYEVFNNLINS